MSSNYDKRALPMRVYPQITQIYADFLYVVGEL